MVLGVQEGAKSEFDARQKKTVESPKFDGGTSREHDNQALPTRGDFREAANPTQGERNCVCIYIYVCNHLAYIYICLCSHLAFIDVYAFIYIYIRNHFAFTYIYTITLLFLQPPSAPSTQQPPPHCIQAQGSKRTVAYQQHTAAWRESGGVSTEMI